MDSLVKAIDGPQAEGGIHYWRSDKWLRRPIRYAQAKSPGPSLIWAKTSLI